MFVFGAGWGSCGTGWAGPGNQGASAGVHGKERSGRGVRAIMLVSDILYYPYTHCCKFTSRYSTRLPCYGLPKKSLRKILKEHNSKKIRKGKQSLLYVTQCLNLKYIAIKFRHDIPNGYPIMGLQK